MANLFWLSYQCINLVNMIEVNVFLFKFPNDCSERNSLSFNLPNKQFEEMSSNRKMKTGRSSENVQVNNLLV